MSAGRSAPARPLAARVLAEVEGGAWSDRLLQARAARLPDARERGFFHTLVLTTLRWQGALDARLAPHVKGGLGRLAPVVRAVLRAAAAEAFVLGHAVPIAVDAAVDAVRAAGVPWAAGLVNAVLRRALADDAPLDERLTLPAWLHERWAARHGAGTAALVAALNAPARAFVIARPDRGTRDELRARLAASGVATEPAARHPWGLHVVHGVLAGAPEFARGDVLAMDEAAALVGLLARPAGGGPVADLAAAPGGKTALLTQLTAAPLVALEFESMRARRLAAFVHERAARPERVAVVRGDARTPPLPRARFDTVLLDAPCTGTGTLRRRPEKRWRLVPEDVVQCAARQRAMLDAAADLVAPGGALVYSVCSLEPEEGRDLVAAFLARRPDFAAEDPAALLGAAAEGLVDGDPPLLSTRPDVGGMDGFVAARLVRRAARAGL